MESPNPETIESPSNTPYTKREAVERLFHLGSPRNSKSINPSRPISQQTCSPQTEDFSDCKDVLSIKDPHDTVSAFQNNGDPSEKILHFSGKQDSTNWNTNPPFSETRGISDRSPIYSTNVGGNDKGGISVSPKSHDTVGEPPSRPRRETFSYTDSGYFRFDETHNLHPPEEQRSIRDSHFSGEGQQSEASGQVSMGNDTDSDKESLPKRRSTSSLKILIVVLCMSLVISLYFAFFGSPISFRNFFNSLTDERKQQLSNELRLKPSGPLDTTLSKTPKQQAKLFVGVTYSPDRSYEPFCGFSKEDAIRDIALLSTVTSKIKTYGTQCNQTEYILHAIHVLGIDTKVAMGIWLSSNEVENQAQISRAKNILLTNPNIAPIEYIFVGNEALRRADISENALISYIQDMKNFLSINGIKISIGTSEFPSFVSQKLVDSCDVIGLTIQPFLAGIPSTNAAQWCLDQFYGLKENFQNGRTNFTITEIGWPYGGGKFNKAEASPPDYQIFMSSWVENKAKRLPGDWFVFEAFNEPWKIRFNRAPDTWETEWGIFDEKMRLRPIVHIFDDNQR
ncbi:hypothetical protein JCM33374_g5712 [Metschnikowia sp. JCM 33374]|nr:hypothetical protein JCM33374_g5712 [Metschnikowia sp. JCM 33374]